MAQEYSQSREDASEFVANGGEDGLCGIAGAALEVAGAELAFLLHVTDEGFDGAAALQFAFAPAASAT